MTQSDSAVAGRRQPRMSSTTKLCRRAHGTRATGINQWQREPHVPHAHDRHIWNCRTSGSRSAGGAFKAFLGKDTDPARGTCCGYEALAPISAAISNAWAPLNVKPILNESRTPIASTLHTFSPSDVRVANILRIPAMPITNSNLMAIRIPIDADHHRSEATLDCTYHR
jgi:hypothetical protein